MNYCNYDKYGPSNFRAAPSSLHRNWCSSLGVARSFLVLNFPSPRKNARLPGGRFSQRDLPGAVMEQRKAGPRDLVVRPQFDGFFSSDDRLVEMAEFHQCHAERVPAVEKVWI